MSAQAPSEGQKVTLGQNAPITREGSGAVACDSLAAESRAFTSSNEMSTNTQSHDELRSSSKPHESGSTAAYSSTNTGAGSGPNNVDTAPSYVNNQYTQDTKGPHGKNIKEDESIRTGDGNNASFTEFGTDKDPGALAEKKFALADSSTAGSTAARQKSIDGKTPYDVLDPEEQA
ncbi:uncharacterized protein BCR38DRAFT_2606 [Pseudomassariella vexata]|uniref:Uncharacterized protein n=1 Tax=Pseudomassariella vexata TaxID=1141098 RepID=A0A1Y2EHI3_9PEZI|nr:uncharacterized protein BCR38DRAFT_2606 [Pseudomassariella vexata]ORY71028.1 hypothetical protein BCR38DRAFT_2606 [Pseudomassariella vexata]